MRGFIKKIEFLMIIISAFMVAVSVDALADDFSGSTMKLMKTEGTVAVIDKKESSVSLFAGMKLNSGYSVATSTKSYAWINLDDNKLVKLDALTNVTVEQSGKNLMLTVNTGKCLIDVPKKLTSDETLNIKTGNVITGIRGTGVIVDAGNDAFSIVPLKVTIMIPEGTVVSSYGDRNSVKKVTTTAGNKTVINLDNAMSSSSSIQTADIPGFAALEIVSNPVMKQRYSSATSCVASMTRESAILRLTNDILDQQRFIENLSKIINDNEIKAINYKVGIRMDYLGQLSDGQYISGMNPNTGEAQYKWNQTGSGTGNNSNDNSSSGDSGSSFGGEDDERPEDGSDPSGRSDAGGDTMPGRA